MCDLFYSLFYPGINAQQIFLLLWLIIATRFFIGKPKTNAKLLICLYTQTMRNSSCILT